MPTRDDDDKAGSGSPELIAKPRWQLLLAYGCLYVVLVTTKPLNYFSWLIYVTPLFIVVGFLHSRTQVIVTDSTLTFAPRWPNTKRSVDLRELSEVRLIPALGLGQMLSLRDGHNVTVNLPSWIWFDWQKILRIVAQHTLEQNVDVTKRTRKKLVSALIVSAGG